MRPATVVWVTIGCDGAWPYMGASGGGPVAEGGGDGHGMYPE